MTAARRLAAIAVAWLLRMTAALLDAIDPPDGSHAAIDAAPSSVPADGAVTLPLARPVPPPGRGQHPYAGYPLYGIATAERDGILLAVDGTGPCAVITEPAVSLQATGWQPALAMPGGIQWATDRDALVRLRNALAAA